MANVKQNSNIRHIFSNTPKDPDILHSRVQRYYTDRLEKKWQNAHPMKGLTPGPDSVLLRTNDYLCLAGDQRVIQAEIKALREYGHGDSASRIWGLHEKDHMRSFELRLARLMQAEDAILCTSGYNANVGLIQSLAVDQLPVYIDMKAHMSLWEGISSAKAKAIPVRHNDANHLERLVKKYGPGYIVVDSLYSTDGDLCPLEEFVEVSEKYNSVMIVDETHSFGTHGPNGAGLVAEKNLSDRVHFRTLGLSKAVASRGGAVICSKRNAEFFRYESFPTIFSTAVLQHEVAGYNAVLDILEAENWRRTTLHKNHKYLRTGLDNLGYNVENCKSQIISLEAGEILNTVALRNALEARDVFGSIFLAPAVPDKRCLIRLTLNCGLSTEQLDYVIAVCEDIMEEVNMKDWYSTKRRKRRYPVNRTQNLSSLSIHAA